MSLTTIHPFLPKFNSDLDPDIEQKCRLHAVKAMRYALDKTLNQLNNGELLVKGSMGNNNGICGVFQYHVNAYLDDNVFNISETILTGDYVTYTFNQIVKSWSKCAHSRVTGNPDKTFPVGGSVEYFEERETNTLWTNPKRIELLNYLIEVANNE
jgi:hypothetical protein